jgi:cytochrome P450
MTREVARDTTLPRGGGPDGKQPIFCLKGDWVNCNRYMLHRDPEFWGSDASEFRPERWDGIRPHWYFVPFGGGPRICPANVMVATEAAYFLVRFCQRFETLESRDDEPYRPVLRAVVSNANGVKIAVRSR